jgi:hypothetical protein
VPSIFISSVQNLARYLGSLSDVIVCGMPCNFTMLSKYILATVGAVVSYGRVNICVYFENRSTTTNKDVPCNGFSGRSVMKSIDKCCQGKVGMGSGDSSPKGLPRWYFMR